MRYILLLCFFCSVLVGCSYAPQPMPRPITSQKTIEAAQHWQEMARQFVAESILFAGQHVYVTDTDNSSFGKAFSQMLRAELMKKGVSITTKKENALVLDWGVQIIRYPEPRQNIKIYPGTYSVIAGAGIGAYYLANANWMHWAVAPTMLASALLDADLAMKELSVQYPLDTEIIFTLTAISGNRIVKQGNAIFYTRRSDAALYNERMPLNANSQPLPQKRYILRNK
jgi:hypothetical protein